MKRQTRSGGLVTLGLAALFLAGFLLLVWFGVQSYRSCVDGQRQNQARRAIPASLSAGVRAFDRENAVAIRDSDAGAVLELADGETGYCTRYFLQNGQLCTDYARREAALQGEQKLFAAKRFTVEWLTDRLLCVTTDAGRTLLCVRSGGTAP